MNEKSDDHNDVETRMFKVLFYLASCNECLRASKVSNLSLGCHRFSFSVTASQIKCPF